MANSIDRMRDLFLSPMDAIAGIKADPAWHVPASIIAVVSFLLGFLAQPFHQKILFDRLVRQFGMKRAHEVLSLANSADLLPILSVPLVILGKCIVATAVIFSAALLFRGSHPSWKPLMAAVVHAELILLLMAVVNLVLVELKGAGTVHSVRDLQPIIGLDYVCRSFVKNPAVLLVLKNANIFSAWYMGVLVCCVSAICELRMWQSFIIVVFTWLAMTAVKVLLWQQ